MSKRKREKSYHVLITRVYVKDPHIDKETGLPVLGKGDLTFHFDAKTCGPPPRDPRKFGTCGQKVRITFLD